MQPITSSQHAVRHAAQRFRPRSGLARAKPAMLHDRLANDDPLRIALCIPLDGSAGIWSPSCLASARLAQIELNRGNGIAGRRCELVPVDASAESQAIEDTLIDLVDGGEVDALVGMHISSVRQRIAGAVGGRIPYVYTCLYEGGESSPEIYAIGETASRQLCPSIAWLSEQADCRRWMLVGNDYIWPRVSHAIAKRSIGEAGGVVMAEAFVPFGETDYARVFDQIRRTRCDAVLISMVGQDAVDFNRAFARAGLGRRALRLSCAIEENQLLAIGAENTENLHVALGYFATLDTDANGAFKERYHGQFGERAPTLNSIGQSLYEGLHFLAAFLGADGQIHGVQRPAPATYPSARGGVYFGAGINRAPMYLARAEGHLFKVIARF